MQRSIFSTSLRTGMQCFLFATALLFACTADDADALDVNDFDSLAEYLEAEADDQNIPGLSALTFEGAAVREQHLIGVADLDTEAALTEEHVYLLASVSKMVTAVALLQLLDEEAFALDDPINDYLPFEVAHPAFSTPITFQMLLTHTSGIGDGDALDDEYHTGIDSPKALGTFLNDYFTPGAEDYEAEQNFYDFEPGTAHEYSNTNAALIGYLVEVISGQEFDAYCRSNIFQRLTMTRTFWRLEQATGPIVSLYDWDGNDNVSVAPYSFTGYPNGGLRSTAKDLQLLLVALSEAYNGTNTSILSSSTAQAMFAPQIPDLDATVGLHTFLFDAGNNVWGHDGGESGAATLMGINPITGAGAVVLANQGEADVEGIFLELVKE